MTLVIDQAKAIQAQQVREDVLYVDAAASPGIAPYDAECHFECPDCGEHCRCTGDARRLPHVRCGVRS
jgi:predicted RNA-binding Zn-ribbon protein involved in translation (DUF1610 family)